MFKKTYSIDNHYLYDYIYSHTKDKLVVFGYFLWAKEFFYGKSEHNIMNVYCSDITACFFNPKIIVKKDNQNNTLITITYNAIHYLFIMLSLIIGVFSALACFDSPLNIFCSFLVITIILFLYKLNFNWQRKRIMNHLLSIKNSTCQS